MNVLRLLGTSVRMQVSSKLGRCSRCMRASLLGALGSVALALVLAVAGLPALLVGVAVLVAASFCGLVLAHAAAYVYHGTHPTSVALSRPCCGQRRPAQRPIVQLERRPVLQVLTSLPAAFGLTYLASVSRAAAQPTGAITDRKVFRQTLSCLPCAGVCTVEAFFEYDYVPLEGSKIQVTRFKMTWNQASTGSCEPSIDRGSGAFDFQCVGDTQPCKLTGGNIWRCPCGTRIEFVPLGTSTAEDCTCPNERNKVAYAQGVCGAPISIEKQCDFQWINLDFTHKVTCSCPEGGITRSGLDVLVQYRDGAIAFGGDIQA
ncbi:MAG: DUF3624 family protein [Betaproteobacteria bacterium]|nr:DUF3624 family protein [Betaproteobacteria bacterium]